MSTPLSNGAGCYRYYVSHAILQKRKAEAGSIARVPAPEIEKVVLDGVGKHLASLGDTEHPTAIDDRDLIERHVERVIVKSQRWNSESRAQPRLRPKQSGPVSTAR
jgi:hypothetical protein